MPDCSRCGDHYTRGHYQRHITFATHQATVRGETPYSQRLRDCPVCEAPYLGGSYAEHAGSRQHEKARGRDCAICGLKYALGEYFEHKLSSEHFEARLQGINARALARYEG